MDGDLIVSLVLSLRRGGRDICKQVNWSRLTDTSHRSRRAKIWSMIVARIHLTWIHDLSSHLRSRFLQWVCHMRYLSTVIGVYFGVFFRYRFASVEGLSNRYSLGYQDIHVNRSETKRYQKVQFNQIIFCSSFAWVA